MCFVLLCATVLDVDVKASVAVVPCVAVGWSAWPARSAVGGATVVTFYLSEFRSCVKVEVAVFGFPS